MAKDPAFLFYPGDWMGGTQWMTMELKGCYMELLILQFNTGGFTEAQAKHVLSICFDVAWPMLKQKFNFQAGIYVNERLQQEITRRKNFTESRRINALTPKSPKKSKKAYAKHMENENENENTIKNRNGILNGNKKTAHPEYSNCIKIYDEFIQLRTSAPARIDGLIGRSMNEIITQLSKYQAVVDKKKTVSELLKYIFDHFSDWSAFHQTQIKLNQINSNLENIINSIKNGKPKSGKNAGSDEIHALAELQRRGVKIDYASMFDKEGG